MSTHTGIRGALRGVWHDPSEGDRRRYDTTETPLLPAQFDCHRCQPTSDEPRRLAAGAILESGSTYGICNSCQAEALGAVNTYELWAARGPSKTLMAQLGGARKDQGSWAGSDQVHACGLGGPRKNDGPPLAQAKEGLPILINPFARIRLGDCKSFSNTVQTDVRILALWVLWARVPLPACSLASSPSAITARRLCDACYSIRGFLEQICPLFVRLCAFSCTGCLLMNSTPLRCDVVEISKHLIDALARRGDSDRAAIGDRRAG